MRTVSIDELQNGLSGYLQCVRDGEEVVIEDQNVPIARISPVRFSSEAEREADLVARGVMRMPEEEMDWDAFFAMPAPYVARDIAVQAVIDGRGDR